MLPLYDASLGCLVVALLVVALLMFAFYHRTLKSGSININNDRRPEVDANYNSEYPYPSLVPLLKFSCSPFEYQHLTSPYIDKFDYLTVDYNKRDAFLADCWPIFPTYKYAQCPICKTIYQEPADTYNFMSWRPISSLYKHLYDPFHDTVLPNRQCSHFLGIHQFLNLHGQPPPRRLATWINRTGEIPRITHWFFRHKIETFAIIHALPICRIAENKFIPAYTLFNLTYFAVDPRILLERHYAEEWERGKGDSEFYPATVIGPAYRTGYVIPQYRQEWETTYDLSYWAEQGLLGWLDIQQPDMPLCFEPDNKLPEIFKNIQGIKYQYDWSKGKVRIY